MGVGVAFREATTVLGPPEGAAEGDCDPLPVRMLHGTLVSCWRLSAHEIDEIIRTGLVWLLVVGRQTQPPVFVTGHKAEVI